MTPEPQPPMTGEHYPIERKNRLLFVVGSLGLLSVVAAAGYFLLLNRDSASRRQGVITPVEVPASGPVEEEPIVIEQVLDRTEWVFEVLNGSGVSGVAASAKTTLEGLGYSVLSTGNADSYDYVNTQLFVTTTMSDKSALLLDDLEASFGVTQVAGELEGSDANARLIIGIE